MSNRQRPLEDLDVMPSVTWVFKDGTPLTYFEKKSVKVFTTKFPAVFFCQIQGGSLIDTQLSEIYPFEKINQCPYKDGRNCGKYPKLTNTLCASVILEHKGDCHKCPHCYNKNKPITETVSLVYANIVKAGKHEVQKTPVGVYCPNLKSVL